MTSFQAALFFSFRQRIASAIALFCGYFRRMRALTQGLGKIPFAFQPRYTSTGSQMQKEYRICKGFSSSRDISLYSNQRNSSRYGMDAQLCNGQRICHAPSTYLENTDFMPMKILPLCTFS